MSSNFGDQVERRVGSLLDRIPGYRGYRSKEDRRDADKRVREHVTAAYTAEADRVAAIAAQLADQRRLNEIGPVDDFAQLLRHFVDRVRTATYGYGGLMGDRDVDANALDQLRQFDEGLLSGVDELNKPITDLETAFAQQGDIVAPARAGTVVVRNLLARFDLRDEVVETGRAASQESVLRVLQPTVASATPPAYALGAGDALAILGDDFLVRGQINVDAGQSSFRLFQLSGDDSGDWLLVPLDASLNLARLTPTAAPSPGAAVTLNGVAFAQSLAASGDGEAIGVGGASGSRPVRFQFFTGVDDPNQAAVVLDWGTEQQAFAGRTVHPNDVEVFGLPSPQLN